MKVVLSLLDRKGEEATQSKKVSLFFSQTYDVMVEIVVGMSQPGKEEKIYKTGMRRMRLKIREEKSAVRKDMYVSFLLEFYVHTSILCI